MGTNKLLSSFAVFFFLLGCSASTSISDGIFSSFTSTGRNLLQTKKACPVNFEFLNYTIITSRCKGPKFPPESCCSAFKEFACPYAEQINDLTTECASTMFTYINLYGKYPPGLFAGECREGKLGLACPALPPSASENASGSEQLISNLLMLVMARTIAVAILL
ncbi:GPI-anchored protein LORELEI [Hibiscus syriacus]|uniref:GPI-anchored protein LORELEI n=1 Tax=Hibiscus syriacus TaxID=106335 RepID=A0A6A2Y9Z5_HIBSY|nr:GPI-anchored protein LLG1-like [Hibiscus syriacus]KAE8679185.1 GPI-anchored protein LORELEI [Hibiscus syriacus]